MPAVARAPTESAMRRAGETLAWLALTPVLSAFVMVDTATIPQLGAWDSAAAEYAAALTENLSSAPIRRWDRISLSYNIKPKRASAF